jgi:TorA maturation chaperone TorD
MTESLAQNREFEQLVARADIYQLLSLFLHLPTLELAEGLLDGSLASDVEQLVAELGLTGEQTRRSEQAASTEKAEGVVAAFRVIAAEPWSAEDYLHALRFEFTRLLTHPTHAVLSLYEALFLYEEKQQGKERPILFTNPAALDAERIYRKAGLARSDEVNESGDHFATQLEFASFLFRQRLSLLDGDPEALATNRAIIEEFEEQHLSRWTSLFFSRLADKAKEPAYHAIGKLGVLVFTEAGELY